MAGCTESEAWPVSPELAAARFAREPERQLQLQFRLGFSSFGAPGAHHRSIYSETRTEQLSRRATGRIRSYRRHMGRHRVPRRIQARLGLKGTPRSSGRERCLRARRTGVTGSSPRATRPFPVADSPAASRVVRRACRCGESRADQPGLSQRDLLDAESSVRDGPEIRRGEHPGHLVDMPAGEARFSAGVHSRRKLVLLLLRSVTDAGFVQRQPDGLPCEQHRGRNLGRRDLRRGASAAAPGQDRASST